MKRKFILTSFIALAALALAACGGGGGEDPAPVTPEMTLTVSSVGETGASLSVTLTKGSVASVKVLDSYLLSAFTGDPDNQTELAALVSANGGARTLPYSKTLSGLTSNKQYISAAVGYDSKGAVVCSAYKTFKTTVSDDTFSDDASAGELDENKW